MICPMCGEREIRPDDELCDACEAEQDEAIEIYDKSVKEGHSHHCASRIAFGDGECECGKGVL